MAKVSFSKVAPKKQIEPKSITINEQEIIVQQYLPIKKKLEILNEIINQVFDDNYIINLMRLEVAFKIAIVKYYTNISITEKMQEDIANLYDALSINNLINDIIAAIPPEEYKFLYQFLLKTIREISKFYQSALGIFKIVATDQQVSEQATDEIVNDLSDPNNLKLIKELMEKMN